MTPELRRLVREKYAGRCAYCGRELTAGRAGDTAFQVDHLHPRYLGGTDDVENLVPACRACNHYKKTFTLEEFRRELSLIPTRLERHSTFRLALAHGLILPGKTTPIFEMERNPQ